jgi:predicted Zn-dependent protease
MAYTHQNNPQRILRQYADNSLASRYARAIVTFHSGGYPVAAPALNGLIEAQPQNPWFHELKGTFLLESGKAKEAVGPLRKAVSLAPRSGYMRIELAQAILESNGGGAEDALKLLRAALVDEDQSYRLQAEPRPTVQAGRVPEANLAAAGEFHKGTSRGQDAGGARQERFARNWLGLADDILAFKEVRG